jgi:GAF domain-containing protein
VVARDLTDGAWSAVFMSRSQYLAEPLHYVTAPYQATSARSSPTSAAAVGRTPEPLPSLVDRHGEQLAGARTLRAAVTALHEATRLPTALHHVLDDSLTLMSAEFANVQIVDPRDGSLVLVAQSGFGPGFLEHFAVVHDDGSVCGRAAANAAQTVVADVREEPSLEPHWAVFRTAGIRAVQSTPLFDGDGRLVGVVSTHTSWPRSRSERDLHLMRIYARFVGDTLARLLPKAPPT